MTYSHYASRGLHFLETFGPSLDCLWSIVVFCYDLSCHNFSLWYVFVSVLSIRHSQCNTYCLLHSANFSATLFTVQNGWSKAEKVSFLHFYEVQCIDLFTIWLFSCIVRFATVSWCSLKLTISAERVSTIPLDVKLSIEELNGRCTSHDSFPSDQVLQQVLVMLAMPISTSGMVYVYANWKKCE